jgi:hypothetical protein
MSGLSRLRLGKYNLRPHSSSHQHGTHIQGFDRIILFAPMHRIMPLIFEYRGDGSALHLHALYPGLDKYQRFGDFVPSDEIFGCR